MAIIEGGSKRYGYLFTSRGGSKYIQTRDKPFNKRQSQIWKKAGWTYKKIWGK